jgi:hypothetical protein
MDILTPGEKDKLLAAADCLTKSYEIEEEKQKKFLAVAATARENHRQITIGLKNGQVLTARVVLADREQRWLILADEYFFRVNKNIFVHLSDICYIAEHQ